MNGRGRSTWTILLLLLLGRELEPGILLGDTTSWWLWELYLRLLRRKLWWSLALVLLLKTVGRGRYRPFELGWELRLLVVEDTLLEHVLWLDWALLAWELLR